MNPKLIAVLLAVLLASTTAIHSYANKDESYLSTGKHLVLITGCNDCYTAGFAPSGGKVPESKWLLGDKLGFHGPWGTTYPINLREYVSNLAENE
jgi:hypothetical protein